MPFRRSVLLLLLSLTTAAFGAGAAFAQIGPPPPIGGTALAPATASDGVPTQAASFDLINLFMASRFSSWGSVSLIQPGIRSSAFALRERRGLMRLIP